MTKQLVLLITNTIPLIFLVVKYIGTKMWLAHKNVRIGIDDFHIYY